MKKELFKIFWENAKSTYPEGESRHTRAILEEDFEKVCDEIIDLMNSKKLVECRNCGDIVEMVSAGEFCPRCFCE